MKKKDILPYLRRFSVLLGSMFLVAAIAILGVSVAKERMNPLPTEPTQVKHRVLFLCSYNPLYFTYDDQIRGLDKSLYSNGIEYDVIYMDTKNYPDEDEKRDFHDFIKRRLDRDRHYEAVILGDDDALVFGMQYQYEFFDGLPMVFFGINNMELAKEAQLRDNMTGFYENDYLAETLSMAVTMFPERKTLVALHDRSAAGVSDKEIFYSLKNQYPDCIFTDIDTSSMTEGALIERLKFLGSDAILFYMTCYSDKYGNTYSMLDRTSTVVNNVSVPIFRNYSGGRDMGVVGGTYMDFEAQAYDAGMVISDVLNDGKDIGDYELDTETKYKSYYSYPALVKYKVSSKAFPADAEYYKKPQSIIETFGKGLPVALLILASLVLFIFSGDIALRYQKLANEEIKQSREKLKYQAEHDEFLDLLNRRSTVEYLSKNLGRSSVYSIVMLDIDGFKSVNETYGHDIADKTLTILAKRLKDLSKKRKYIIGRYGGDEFILMVPDKNLTENSNEIREIVDEFCRPILIGDETVVLSISVGVSNSDDVYPPEQQLINAEIAMFEAKEKGKNMVFVYTGEMKEKIIEENRIKGYFHDAFSNDGFYMVYQPKIDAKEQKVVGYEALVRMKDNAVSPAVFVPIIEKNGWVTRLGRLTTRLVVEQLSIWKRAGKKIYPVSINFSSKQINDVGYAEFLRDLLDEFNISPKYIEIEITESLLMENSALTEGLFADLKKMGIKLLLDDFGTGYSSLGYLIYMPIDDIKLDKSLVDAYLVDGRENFIKDVILLVHDMQKTITVEGVEEKWQYEKLREFGADTIQGYYFSKPLKAEDAISFETKLEG
ncbi:bifunctional diguanylate cyclase/phosphodiesterase [Butyrivibrio proteoclasticus]|uniref:bifunctional diguanylate cyclase/phosphodiesterase n=1 Tax=Butyrivibrio proteoclasticus TaxID=43305 RepID=UPI0018CC2C5F|nr:bifunctional diguanylate cyclase/phosphodiesterase [Butyrivibrio proteoclasticus]